MTLSEAVDAWRTCDDMLINMRDRIDRQVCRIQDMGHHEERQRSA